MSQHSITLRITMDNDSRQIAIVVEDTGIGLHLVYELVRVHHGTIRFDENPQGGAIFTVTLPTDRDCYEERDFLRPSPLTPQTSPLAINDYRELAPEPLNDRRVLIVEDDADKETTDIPIILLTAITAEEKKVKGFDSGADAYLEKPFSMKVLIATCRQLISQRDHIRMKYAKAVNTKATVSDLNIDTYYFSKLFKSYYGISPSQYRKGETPTLVPCDSPAQ